MTVPFCIILVLFDAVQLMFQQQKDLCKISFFKTLTFEMSKFTFNKKILSKFIP